LAPTLEHSHPRLRAHHLKTEFSGCSPAPKEHHSHGWASSVCATMTRLSARRSSASGPHPATQTATLRSSTAAGPRLIGRFFTAVWHEVARLLALPPQERYPVNRSSLRRCPVEQLMDKIAGELGFFNPIFRPALSSHLGMDKALTFDVVEAIRQRFCPIASFQANLIACVRRVDQPAIYLEAGMGYKVDELKEITSP